MADLVRVRQVSGVSVITLQAPPANVLGREARLALSAAIIAAEAEAASRAIVITGSGRCFATGRDVRDLKTAEESPTLREICLQLENSAKPVVAALHGQVSGGGLELALAAHWRTSASTARFGFPEVGLGLMPAAGATQRAPRLIGAEAALALLLEAKTLSAGEALSLGLIDGMVEGDVVEAAVMLAQTCGPRPTLQRRDRIGDGAGFLAAVAAARERLGPGEVAAKHRIIEAVEAALLLPVDAALALEHAAFEECRVSADSVLLRHVFVAERRLGKMPEAGAKPRPLEVVGVVGAGELGASIALAVISAGLRCVIVEKDRPSLVAALERLALAQEDRVEAGQITEASRDSDWARLAGAANLSALADADMVIEAVPEDMATKASVLSQVAALVRPGAVIAVTSAGLPVRALAQATRRVGDVISFGLPSPLPGPRLVEIAVHADADPTAVATGLALARRLGRQVMRVRAEGPGGLIAARFVGVAQAVGEVLAQRGVDQAAATQALGEIGLGWVSVPALVPAPGVDGGRMTPEEIRARMLAALVNAGAGMVASGEVQRPSDIDMLSILTLGMPRRLGGLMQMGDSKGMLALRRDLLAFAPDEPELWDPQPLIIELFRTGGNFAELNEA